MCVCECVFGTKKKGSTSLGISIDTHNSQDRCISESPKCKLPNTENKKRNESDSRQDTTRARQAHLMPSSRHAVSRRRIVQVQHLEQPQLSTWRPPRLVSLQAMPQTRMLLRTRSLLLLDGFTRTEAQRREHVRTREGKGEGGKTWSTR